MADNQNPIKYSDLISPDNSIKDLIEQLEQLSETYAASLKAIKDEAIELAANLKKVSGATKEGRDATQKAAAQADKLAAAEKKLTEAQSENAKQLEKLRQATKEQNTLTRLQEKLNKSAEGSYNRLSAQYALNKIRLNAMSKAEREAEGAGKALEEETRKIYEEMKRLQAATGKMQLNVGNYPQLFGAVAGSFGSVGTSLSSIVTAATPAAAALAGVGIAAAAAAKVTKDSLSVTMDYNHAVSVLSAITSEAREDLSQLTDQARELGATTKYTATEVVQLQTELAKLGYSKGDIYNMTQYVLQFSQATGASLADAASLAGAALRMFEADTTQTQEFVDKMSAATTKSALSFTYLQNSLSTAAPVANAFGFKVEDVLALLGQLANAGFDASSAATATRNILLNLADANGKLAKSLGKPVTNLDELLDGLIALQAAGLDLGTALDLTDKRSVAAFETFLKGADDARELRDALNDASGAAADMAKTMADDLQGDIASLGSAYDDLMITLGGGQSVWRNLTQWATDVVRAINGAAKAVVNLWEKAKDKIPALDQLIAGFARNIPVVGPLIGGLQAAGNAVGKEADKQEKRAEKSAKTTKKKTKEQIEAEKKAAEEAKKRLAEQAAEEEKKHKAKEKREADAAKREAERAKREAEQKHNTNLQLLRKAQDAELELETDAFAKRRQKTIYQYDREIEDLAYKLKTDEKLTAEGREAITKAIATAEKRKQIELAKLAQEETIADLNLQKDGIKLRLQAVQEGSEQEFELKRQQIEIEKQIAIEKNNALAETERQSTAEIIAVYDEKNRQLADTYTKHLLELFDKQQEFGQSEFDLLRNNEERKTRFRLQAEKERLQKILELNEQAGTKLTDVEISTIKNQIAKIDKEMSESVTKERTGDIYGMLGLNLDDKQKEAINTSYQFATQQLNAFMQARTQAAQKAVEASDKEVDAAQKRLDAEIQSRNNGYANNVETARKELENAKKTQEKALAAQRKAQKQEAALQAVQEAGNLVLASAKIWGQLGFPYAIPAIAVMWGSFAAAKIKAMQVANQSTEKYGDGTIELLQGGSHQSGNDIDLGTKPDGTRRRAEGGEYFAVINKRNSRKYRGVIPDIIQALNNGTFENKYLSAYDGANELMTLNVQGGNFPDISALSNDVHDIKEQGEFKTYSEGGKTIQVYKNLKRIIR